MYFMKFEHCHNLTESRAETTTHKLHACHTTALLYLRRELPRQQRPARYRERTEQDFWLMDLYSRRSFLSRPPRSFC